MAEQHVGCQIYQFCQRLPMPRLRSASARADRNERENSVRCCHFAFFLWSVTHFIRSRIDDRTTPSELILD